MENRISLVEDWQNKLTLIKCCEDKGIYVEQDTYCGTSICYYKWGIYREGIEVIICGDKDEPDQRYIKYAEAVLEKIDKYIALCENRIQSWFYKTIKCQCLSIEVGPYYYRGFEWKHNIVSITVKAEEYLEENWDYTVRFSLPENGKLGWPIGCEVWSKALCHKLEKEKSLIGIETVNIDTIDEIVNEMSENKALQKEIVDFVTHYMNADQKIKFEGIVNEYTTLGRYCGTELLEGYFAMSLLDSDVGNELENAYSGYNLKYVGVEHMIPVAIEFFVM